MPQLDTSGQCLYSSGIQITLSCDFGRCSSDFPSQDPLQREWVVFFVAPQLEPTGMAELALQGVSKTYSGHVAAVQDLDLTIHDHELVVLVGPSGCGKTTTLRLIAGLDDPSHGVIRIDGRSVNQVAPRDRNIAMVFQHSALYPHLTVYDNIAFGLRLRHGWRGVQHWWPRRGWSQRRWKASWNQADDCDPPRRQAIGQAVRQASHILGLELLLERKPSELSGGERQRVALGRAIVRRPAAFLFDEPLSHLDPQQRVEMRDMIKRLHRQLGTTMVHVTHDQAEALALGDRIAVMNQGRIEQIASPRELYLRPANQFVARFIGEPAMNMVTGRFTQKCYADAKQTPGFVGGGLIVRMAELPTAVQHFTRENRDVVMGIRPEHVQLASTDGDGGCLKRGARHEGCREENRQQGNSSRETFGGGQPRRWSAQGRVTSTAMLGATTVVRVALNSVTPDSSEADRSRVEPDRNLAPPPNGGLVSSTLTVVLPTSDTVQVGSRVAISLDSARAHWFDVETGLALNE